MGVKILCMESPLARRAVSSYEEDNRCSNKIALIKQEMGIAIGRMNGI